MNEEGSNFLAEYEKLFNGKPTPAEPTEPVKDPEEVILNAEEKEDSTTQTPGEVVDNTEEVVDDDNFWGTVESLLGDKLPGELPADIEPNTAEAISFYLNKTKEATLQSYIESLQETLPDVYDYMLYRSNGGTPDKFFAQEVDYSNTIVTSEDQAKDIVRRVLKENGLKDNQINTIIKAAIEDETIINDAQEYVNAYNERQLQQRKELIAQQHEEQKAYETFVMNTQKILSNEIISNGNLGQFTIPTEERKAFNDFINQSLVVTPDKQVFIVKPLDQSNLSNVLQEAYFGYKKGDLSKLIKKAAATANANTIKLNIQKNKQTNNNKGTQPKTETSESTLELFTKYLR